MPTISIGHYVTRGELILNFIKIDSENADYEIHTGMEETLERCRTLMSVEVGDMDIDGVPSSKTIVRFLVERGYQPSEYLGGKIIEHRPLE